MPFRRFKSFSRGAVRRKGINKSGLVRRAFSGRKRKASTSIVSLTRKVRKISATVETKSGVQTFADGIELGHNRISTYSSNMLATSQGTADSENIMGTRIGDKITLMRVQIKGMLELNERYSDVGVKVMMIKSAKGDVSTDGNIWQGASAKLLDTFNTERFTVMKRRFIKMRAPNQGNTPSGVQTVGGGFQVGTNTISRATRMFNISIPGRRFGRNGVLQYENGSQQPKFFDYHPKIASRTSSVFASSSDRAQQLSVHALPHTCRRSLGVVTAPTNNQVEFRAVQNQAGDGLLFVLTLFVFKAPNYVLPRTLTERVV